MLSALACLILLSLCGCHQHDHASSSASGPARTTITALIWAPDWPEEMLLIMHQMIVALADLQPLHAESQRWLRNHGLDPDVRFPRPQPPEGLPAFMLGGVE